MRIFLTYLLQIAKEDNLNLSKMLEESLEWYRKKKLEKEWVEKNRKAFDDDYNRMVNEYGLYSVERWLFRWLLIPLMLQRHVIGGDIARTSSVLMDVPDLS